MCGLGKGVFPKDKIPNLPVHPHCLCHLAPVYLSKLKGKTQKDNIKEAGDEWLKSLPKQEQYKVLGLNGLKAWQNGADWRNYARNYSTDYAKTRLKDLNIKLKNDIIKVSKITLFAQPNAITERISSKGGIERNFYDEKGRQYKQIANNNHGNAKNHPYGKHGEHAHDYIYDKEGKLVNRTIRELTDDERKEVEDIL